MIDLFYATLEQHFVLNDSDKKLIKERTKIVKYKAKTQLLKSGDISDTSYFVVSGVLRYYCNNSVGDEITDLFASENKIVSSVKSYLKRVPSDKSIGAVTAVELIELKVKDYKVLVRKIPSLQMTLFKISNSYLVDNYNFYRHLITLEAKDRYLAFMKKYPTILNRVPLSQVASFLGINQSTLSRIRKQAVESWQEYSVLF